MKSLRLFLWFLGGCVAVFAGVGSIAEWGTPPTSVYATGGVGVGVGLFALFRAVLLGRDIWRERGNQKQGHP